MSPWPTRVAGLPLPAAFVDLDAFDANLGVVLDRLAPHVTVRIATKSVRVPDLLRRALDADPRVRGLMTYHPAETAWLAARGFRDLLLAYPVARAPDAAPLADAVRAGARVRVIVDDAAQVAVLAALDPRPELAIDVDASIHVLGQHVGVRRSPIRDPEAALAVAQVARDAGLQVTAVMAYEAQVAGLRDHVPGRPWLDVAFGWLKARSRPVVRARRQEVAGALRDAGHAIDLVNGGGSGSVRGTSHDGSVTEVAAGSALLAPHLFDGYDDLPVTPAGYFALPLTRRPDAGHVTAFGGGIVASGEAGPDRLPVVVWPAGLSPLSLEGFGEVQTPLRRGEPDPGDAVVCRPAKAGEWLERFAEVHLVRGDARVGRATTYRGGGLVTG